MGRYTSHSRSRSRSRGPPTADSRNGEEPARLHVSDLGRDVREADVDKEFGRFGPLAEPVWLAKIAPLFAFVVFKYRKDAEAALAEVDGRPICGDRVKVSWAKPRNRDRFLDPGNRCYSCGEPGHIARRCTNRQTGGSDSRSGRRGGRSRSRSRSRDRHRRDRSRSRSHDRHRRDRRRSRSRSRSPRRHSPSRSHRGSDRGNDRRRH